MIQRMQLSQSSEPKRRFVLGAFTLVFFMVLQEIQERYKQSYYHYERTHRVLDRVSTSALCDIDAFVYETKNGVDIWIGQRSVCLSEATRGVFAWMVDHCRSSPTKRMVLLVDELTQRTETAPVANNLATSVPLYVRLMRKSPLLANSTHQFVRYICGGEQSRCALNNLRVERVPYDKKLLQNMDGAKVAVGTWGVLFGGLTDEQTKLELELPVTDTVVRFMADILLFLCGQGRLSDERTKAFMQQAFGDMSLESHPLDAFADEWERTGFTYEETLVAVHSQFAELMKNAPTSTEQWLSRVMSAEGAMRYVAAVHNTARLLRPSPRFVAGRVVYISNTLAVFMQARAFLDLHYAVEENASDQTKVNELKEAFQSTRLEKKTGEEDIFPVNLSKPVTFFDGKTSKCIYVPYIYRFNSYDKIMTELLSTLLPEFVRHPPNWYRSIPVYRELSNLDTSSVKVITGVKGIYTITDFMGRNLLMFGELHDTTGLLCDDRNNSMSANEYMLNEIMHNPTKCYDVMYENAYTNFKTIGGGGERSDQRHIRLSSSQTIFTTRSFFQTLCGDDHRQCGLDNLRVHYWDTRQLYSASGQHWKHPYEKLMKSESGTKSVSKVFWDDIVSTTAQKKEYTKLMMHLCGRKIDPTLQTQLDKLYAAEDIDPEQPQVDVFNDMFEKRYTKMDSAAEIDLDRMLSVYATTTLDANNDILQSMQDIELAWTDMYAITRMFTEFENTKESRVKQCAAVNTMKDILYYAGDAHAERVYETLSSYQKQLRNLNATNAPNATFKETKGNSECTKLS